MPNGRRLIKKTQVSMHLMFKICKNANIFTTCGDPDIIGSPNLETYDLKLHPGDQISNHSTLIYILVSKPQTIQP